MEKKNGNGNGNGIWQGAIIMMDSKKEPTQNTQLIWKHKAAKNYVLGVSKVFLNVLVVLGTISLIYNLAILLPKAIGCNFCIWCNLFWLDDRHFWAELSHTPCA